MKNRDEPRRNYFRDSDLFKQVDPNETELAFQFQNYHPDDQDILEQIVFRYADRLNKWVAVLLNYRLNSTPTHEQVLSVLNAIFVKAFKRASQFHGQASISNWLFATSYMVVRGIKSKNLIIKNLISHDNGSGNSDLPPKPDVAYWESVDRLPERLRLPLILRYLFDYGIQDIAQILNLPTMEIHNRLVRVRNQLLVRPLESHMDIRIQAYADGLLDANQIELVHLEEHLAQCTLCQTSANKIAGMEKILAEGLKRRWEFPSLSIDDLNEFIQSLSKEINQSNGWWKVYLPLRQTVWFVGLSLAFIALAILFIRLTPMEREFTQAEIKATPQLPPIIEMQPAIKSSDYVSDLITANQYIEPDFSSDGNWGVFASIKLDPNTHAMLLPTIELFDRVSNTIQIISTSTATVNLPWVWWDLAPSISGNGRWIAYVSSIVDPNIEGEPCVTADQHACLDIFLYDHRNGITHRLTHGVNGSSSDGDSFAPTVSVDGKWVAFWSAASNLVTEGDDTCQQAETNFTCLYIYLYNLENGKIEQIPIGTVPGNAVFGVDRISLSADGRYVGFTVSSSVQAGTPSSENQLPLISKDGLIINHLVDTSILNMEHGSEAIVYDRKTGKYEIENQTKDGTPGDGASSSPIISADGRYVAFISSSTNLVESDTNGYSDVFFRDRVSGKVELISISSDGRNGNGDSGLNFWDRGYYSLNLSDNARYIVFESTATNLGQNLNSRCNHIGMNICRILYVHDRSTGATEWISALSNGYFSFFPEISSDGRWVTFMQSFRYCKSSQSLCSNVMLFDRQNTWMANLTKFDEASPKLSWPIFSSLVLPRDSWGRTTIAFSLDGEKIALGGSDSKIRIWRISKGRQSINQDAPVGILGTEVNDQFSALAFSPGGEMLAAGTTNGAVEIWNLSDGILLYDLKNQSGLIRKLVFSPDGSHLVISTLTDTWIWSISDSQLINVNSFSYGITIAFAIDIAAKGNLLATSRGDGSVWLQNLPSGKVIGRLRSTQLDVSSLAISEDGSLLATRSIDGTINLWQIGTANSTTPSFSLIKVIQSYGYLGPLVFSPDDKYLASASEAGGVALWSVPDGNIFSISSSAPTGKVYSLAFSKSGDKLAAVIDNEIVLWEIPSEHPSDFFTHSAVGTYIDSPPLPEATANDITQLQQPDRGISDDHLTLDQVGAHLNFPLLMPTNLPENISFREARDNRDGSVWLFFDVSNQQGVQSSLSIYEKMIRYSNPPTMTIGAGAEIIFTEIDTSSGSIHAEYVRGDWVLTHSFTKPTGDSPSGELHVVWQWEDASASQRLRWQQYGLFIAMYYQVNNIYTPVLDGTAQGNQLIKINPLLTQEDLEQIASGMMRYSDAKAMTFCEEVADKYMTLSGILINPMESIQQCKNGAKITYTSTRIIPWSTNNFEY